MTFEDFGLNKPILSSLEKIGFIKPTPIQEKVIPIILSEKNDLVALAQTGTGKTAAFALPIIHNTDIKNTSTQAIVLCPTRELCVQLARDFTTFAQGTSQIKILAVYGGAPISKQIRSLRQGVQIIVATPGRMHDLIRSKKANLENVTQVVLDEADEMLSMGFLEDLEGILKAIPTKSQKLLFSATMPRQVTNIAKRYMNDPNEIIIGEKNSTPKNIDHVCYAVPAKNRYDALKRIVDLYPKIYSIIFCRTRAETQQVASKLIQDGYNADAIHGDLAQSQREIVLGNFRKKNLQMIVATDVAARGIDVNDLTHVINYNLPDSPEIYTHRSGRTGRVGKSGTSIVIINIREKQRLNPIERIIKQKFEFKKVPSGEEVCAAQLMKLINNVKNVKINHKHIDRYLPSIMEEFKDINRDEIIKQFVSLEFNRFLDYYKNAPDLNANERGMTKRDRLNDNSSRVFISIGQVDSLKPRDLINLINKVTPELSINIGRIDIMERFSFFNIDKQHINTLLRALNKETYGQRKIFAEPAQKAPSTRNSHKKDTNRNKAKRPFKKAQVRNKKSTKRKNTA